MLGLYYWIETPLIILLHHCTFLYDILLTLMHIDCIHYLKKKNT